MALTHSLTRSLARPINVDRKVHVRIDVRTDRGKERRVTVKRIGWIIADDMIGTIYLGNETSETPPEGRAVFVAEPQDNLHILTMAGSAWSIQHSLECRVAGNMHACKYHQYFVTDAVNDHDWHPPPGRYIMGLHGKTVQLIPLKDTNTRT